MNEHFEKHIAVDTACTAIELLAQHCSLSRQQLKNCMMNGAVWLESGYGVDRIRRAKKRLKPGETLHIYYDSDIQQQTPPPANLLSDEDDYSIWDKPAGMFSQGSKWGDHCTLYRWAEGHLSRPAYTVHRLDRAASGLMILAHNKQTATAFLEQFQQRVIEKHYRAIVKGDIRDNTFPLTIDTVLDDRPAHSVLLEANYNESDNTGEVIVDIKTGRKHQIRRHLSAMGHPIVGDRLYGAGNTDVDLQLRSVMLKFACPIDGTVKMWTLDGYAPST